MQPTAGLSKCKLFFITLDEKSGAEKKTSTTVLVQASDLRDAVKKLDEGMKGTMADYVIASVAETAIMDVYPYEAESDVKTEFPVCYKTEAVIKGKNVVVDKTGEKTVITVQDT